MLILKNDNFDSNMFKVITISFDDDFILNAKCFEDKTKFLAFIPRGNKKLTQ